MLTQFSQFLYHIKTVIITFSSFLIFSCNNSMTKLTNIYGKTLKSPRGHLYGSSELKIYEDSTFTYYEAGPGIKYATGTWKQGRNKTNLLLTTSSIASRLNKSPIDTVFLEFSNAIVELNTKHGVKFKGNYFHQNFR